MGVHTIVIGYFYLPQIPVIPAKAGIQPVVISMSYAGLGSGLRRNDGLLLIRQLNMLN